MEEIRARWYEMALKVLENCKISSRNLVDQNPDEIDEIMEADTHVLSETRAIQRGCLELLALQQPMAIDLRVISSLLRSADDIERINRSCIHIAEVARAKLYNKDINEFQKILLLADQVLGQLEDGIEAFNSRDVETARSVIEKDVEIDKLHSEVFGSLLDRVKHDDARASLLMFVSRWMERIGDRAVKVASRAIYIVDGEDVEFEAEIGEHKVFPNGKGNNSIPH
jgi:phosphate transport system protein